MSSSVPDKERYSRVERLVSTSVLGERRVILIGVGRMGDPVVNQLVRHGVGCGKDGNILLIDGDVVEPPNLVGCHYTEKHVGRAKVEAQAEILREINSGVKVQTATRMISAENIEIVKEVAASADLLCLFADDFEMMLRVSDECYESCPQVMAAFGTQCDFAEVAFSIGGQTPPLRRILGKRQRERIGRAQALGVDTAFVASFVASVCLRLLVNQKGAGVLGPCYANAPLFLIGLRRQWLFSELPEDQVRTIFLVGRSDEDGEST